MSLEQTCSTLAPLDISRTCCWEQAGIEFKSKTRSAMIKSGSYTPIHHKEMERKAR